MEKLNINFTLPEVDWNDVGKTITRAPQLIRERVLNELNLNNDTMSELDSITRAQIIHANETIQRYEGLKDSIKKHETAFTEYIQHMTNIVKDFEDMLGEEYNKGRKVSQTIQRLKQKVKNSIESFNCRINHVLTDFLRQLKNLQKIIKERGYLELDLKKYISENKKLKEKQQLTDKEYKKVFENERRTEEVKEKYDNLNNLLKIELPSFLILSNKIGENLSIFIYFYIHDLYHSMYDTFMQTKSYFPNNGDLSNLYFENNAHTIKETQKSICGQIEAFQLFNKYANVYNVLQKSSTSKPSTDLVRSTPNVSNDGKLGYALFDFDGQEKTDLIFKKGDSIVVLEEAPSGWWKGRLLWDGSVGFFPYNYFSFN